MMSVYRTIVKMLCLLSYPFINKMFHFFYFELTIVVLLILDILRVKVCHIVRAG